MNIVNASLNTIGTGLVALGFAGLSSGFSWGGVVEVVLGLGCFLVYEFTPVSK